MLNKNFITRERAGERDARPSGVVINQVLASSRLKALTKKLVLSIAAIAFVALSQGAARADCVITVAGNALNITAEGGGTVTPITLNTSFAGNVLTTTLSQPGGTNAAVLAAIGNPEMPPFKDARERLDSHSCNAR
jgi:hypothetical protein